MHVTLVGLCFLVPASWWNRFSIPLHHPRSLSKHLRLSRTARPISDSIAHDPITPLPKCWDEPLFKLSPTLYILLDQGSPLARSASRLRILPSAYPLPAASPVLDPSIRLVQADAARLTSQLRRCNRIEESCNFALQWVRARLPLLQWVSTRWVPAALRSILPDVPLSDALETIDPWRLARTSFRVAPLHTTSVLAQLSWLFVIRKVRGEDSHRRRQQSAIPRILSALASAFESMAKGCK